MSITMTSKNLWASSNGIEQQRGDLFRVHLTFPTALGGANTWENECMFAVEQFPFPTRAREMIPIKYLNQTNFAVGAETASDPIDIRVRYAFNAKTAVLLEKWHWMTSNPKTGACALSSMVKTNGVFEWLRPDPNHLTDTTDNSEIYTTAAKYKLEGCLIKGLKPSDANMNAGNELVTLDLQVQIDRYYPAKTSDLFTALTGSELADTTYLTSDL